MVSFTDLEENNPIDPKEARASSYAPAKPTPEEPGADLPNWVKRVGQGAVDTIMGTASAGAVAADSFFLGAPAAVSEPIMGLANVIKGAVSNDKGVLENFKEGVDNQKAAWDQHGERLGTGPEFAAQLLGGIYGGARGPVKEASENAFDALYTKGSQGSVFPRLSRALKDGTIGGGENVAASLLTDPDRYMEDPFGSAGVDFGVGATASSAMQLAAGEMAPLISKWMSSDWDKAEVIRGLVDRGVDPKTLSTIEQTGQVTPQALLTAARNAPPNKGLLDGGVGGVSQEEMLSRYIENIADINYYDYDPSLGYGVAPKQFGRDVSDAIAESKVIFDNIGEEIQAGVDKALHNPLGPKDMYKKIDEDLGPVKDLYEKTFRTDQVGPNGQPAAGARPANYDKVVERLGQDVMGGQWGKLTDMDDETQQVWETVKTSLRPKEQDKFGKGVHAEAVEERGGKPVGAITVSRMQNASQSLNKYLRNGILDGNSYDPKKARAAAKMKKSLNDQIATRTFGANTKAAKDFHKYMNIRDQYDFGMEVAEQGLTELPSNPTRLTEYTEKLTPDELAGMQEGYGYRLQMQFNDEGFYKVMNKLVGDGEIPAVNQVGAVNKGKVDVLQRMIGKEDADELVKVYREGGPRQKVAAALTDMLEGKRFKPEAVVSAVRDGDGLIISSGLRPGDNSLWANASIGAWGRKLGARGGNQGSMATKLLTAKGDDLFDTTQDYVRALERPTSVKRSVGTGPAFAGDDQDGEEQSLMQRLGLGK